MIPGNLTMSLIATAVSLALSYSNANTNLITDHINTSDILVGMVGLGSTVYAMSNTGKVVRSTNNGANWVNTSRVNIAEPKHLVNIGSKILAIGYTGEVASTTDMVNWTYGASDLKTTAWASKTVEAVYWTGSMLVITGGSSGVATTTDGITWTYRGGIKDINGGLFTTRCIGYSGSLYLIGGDGGILYSSPDCITWTNRTSNLTGTGFSTATVYAIAYGNGKFVLAGAAARVATSTDGVTWTYVSTLRSSTWTTAYDVGQLVFSGGVFYVRPSYGSGVSFVATSTDGATWTAYTSSSQRPLYGHALFIYNSVFYSYGGFGSMSYSTTLPTWVWPTDIVELGWGGGVPTGFSVLNDGRVLLFNNKGSMAITSDGSTWTFLGTILNDTGVTIGNTNINCVAVGANNQLLLFETGTGGGAGAYHLSAANSLTSFTRYTLNTSVSAYPIWDGSKYVSVGNGGTVRYSTDGITWGTGTDLSTTSWGSATILNKVIYTGSFYLAVGNNGKYARSSDGINWTYQGALGTSISDVHWDGTKFVAVGGVGYLATSSDGITWTTSSTFSAAWGSYSTLCVTKFKGVHYVFGNSGRMASSSDGGVTWEILDTLTTGQWGAVTVHKCVAIGDRILISSQSTSASNKLVGSLK